MRYGERLHSKLPRHLRLMTLGLAAALFSGCSDAPSAAPADGSAAPAPVAASTPNEGSAEQDTVAQSSTSEASTIVAPGAIFDLPESWTREQPSVQMRLAQARIPGSGGEAELTVFYFGPGGGGGLEANLQRWLGQVDAEGEALRESFTLGDWTVTWIDVAGVLKPSTMGTGPSEPQPGSRLLGAVVEGEGGPWFFKATGPADSLDEQRDAFLRMLKSGRAHP